MAQEPTKILAVDDDVEVSRLISDFLTGEGFSVTALTDSLTALKALKSEDFDVMITDLRMSGLKGFDLLEEAGKTAPLMPVIIITAFGTIPSAIEAMKMGAFDYIPKPFQMDELVRTVKKALERRRLKKETFRLNQAVESKPHFHKLIGQSAAMQRVYNFIERISGSSSNVLLTGESGTGKELVARAIHYTSLWKQGPFVAVNCAAIPETLLESELFGYKKGAFTDAKTDKKGLIFEADEGTLFLDEITEMPMTLQAKLLRVIENREGEGPFIRLEVRPLGDTVSYPLDVRIISASNRDIKSLIQKERFREDLYYRLKVIDIELPPLRERREDIPLLIRHFIDKFNREMKKGITGIAEDCLRILLDYPWPGNVRELENVLQRALTLCQQKEILAQDLPSSMVQAVDENVISKALKGRFSLDELEKEYIRRVLSEVDGNKTKAAEILGVDRKTLHRKLQGRDDESNSGR